MIIIIGFEYICNLYTVKYTEIADELDISKQTINSWVSGRRKIPNKHLETLAKKFEISQEYFQKELDDIDKLKIQKIKIENEMVEIEYEDTAIDEQTGEEYTYTRTCLDSGEEFYLQHLTYEIKEKELYDKIKKTLSNCFNDNEDSMYGGLNDAWTLLEDFHKFIDIINDKKVNQNTIRKILRAIGLAYGKGFDSDRLVRKIVEAIKEEEVKTKKEMEEILELWGYDEK